MSKAFVLHSGGLDSTVCLALAIRDFGKANVISVGMNYGQLHREKELEAAEQICIDSGVRRIVHDIRGAIPKGGLSDPDFKVPNISYSEIKGVSPTYVPFRNGTMLSLLAGIATTMGDKGEGVENAIYFGAHAEDAQNWAYPDCTPEFVGAMGNAIYVGTYGNVRLKAPLEHLMKSEIVSLGIRLGAVDLMAKSWSCYKGEELQCGVCPTCISRKEAFRAAGYPDPTKYAG